METFPDIRPDAYTVSQFYSFEDCEIESEADLSDLIQILFDYPERPVYLFHQVGSPWSPLIDAARDENSPEGSLLLNETEFRYFRHPNIPRDFIHISEKAERSGFGWEAPVVQAGPEFSRHRLRLTERARRSLQIKEHIEAERSVPDNPLELKPNFFGVGIDLSKAWTWLRRRRRSSRPRV